jgi:hypothetical protein
MLAKLFYHLSHTLSPFACDTQMTCRNFRVLRALGSTLRMKEQVDSSSRGQEDFICREEKRKAA